MLRMATRVSSASFFACFTIWWRRSSVRAGWEPDDLAVVPGVEAEVRCLDGLLDRGQDLGVPGLDGDQRRVGHGEVRHLVQVRRGPVVVHHDAVQDAPGTPGRS